MNTPLQFHLRKNHTCSSCGVVSLNVPIGIELQLLQEIKCRNKNNKQKKSPDAVQANSQYTQDRPRNRQQAVTEISRMICKQA